MACIDEARAQETREKVKAFESYRLRLLNALEPLLRRFIRTDVCCEILYGKNLFRNDC